MPTDPDTGDLKREIQATLAARRELGPEFDEHFLDRLVEQLKRDAQPAAPPTAPLPSHNALSAEQRTAVAVCSLVFGIPLVAISGAYGIAYLVLVLVMILGVNFAVNWRR